MNMCERKHFRWDYAVYVLFCVFYFWLAFQIPYSYDDWVWGSPAGLQDWLHAQSNSRYVGNFFEILMSRSELLKTLIMGTGTFLIPSICTHIACMEMGIWRREQRVGCFVICNLLLLSLNRVVWQQTYGWVAGFANFVLACVFVLLNVQQLLPFLHDKPVTYKRPRLQGMVMFCLGLLGQMLAENVTVFMLGFVLAVCVVCYIRTKSIPPQLIASAAGILIGMLIMFSSSFYSTLLNTGEALDGYRKLPVLMQDGFLNMVIYCVREAMILFVWIWRFHWMMAVAVLILMSVLVLRCKTQKYMWLRWPVIGLNSLLAVYFIVNDIWEFALPVAFVTAFDILFYFAIMGQFVLVFLPERTRIWKMMALWLSVVVVMIPLAITSERGYRVFLTPQVLLILICGLLLCEVMKTDKRFLQRLIAVFCVLGIVLSLSWYGHVYAQIGSHKRLRDRIITEAVDTGAETITLPTYPYEPYLWLQDPDPHSGWGCDDFKAFYGIASDVDLVIE